MVLTKQNDFVEIDYVGRIKESNQVFDLTNKELARKENIQGHHHFGPKVICLGLNAILPALDQFLINKETNKSYTLELAPEKAFGKKDLTLIKTVPLQVLKEQKINPFPGLQINAEGTLGTIKSVAGGRVTVDFNHPLASKTLIYEVTINKIISDNKVKVESLVQSLFGVHDHDFEVSLENNKAKVSFKGHQLPKELEDKLVNTAKELIPAVEILFA